MSVVYVLSSSGKPLIPTTRCGHVRILLKERKARVVERVPFTIQLRYETPDVTQPLYLGIDPGRTNIGAAVVRENGKCLFFGTINDQKQRRAQTHNGAETVPNGTPPSAAPLQTPAQSKSCWNCLFKGGVSASIARL